MHLYGIREVRDGKTTPMCILAQAQLNGADMDRLDSEFTLDITAAITLTTGRLTMFASPDLEFVSELFVSGNAVDYKEYFEFKPMKLFGEIYEIFNWMTGEAVEPIYQSSDDVEED